MSEIRCTCGYLLIYATDICPICLPDGLARRPSPTKSIISEARDLAILICPLQWQLEDGDAIERMPDDLLRTANMLQRLCNLVENRNE